MGWIFWVVVIGVVVAVVATTIKNQNANDTALGVVGGQVYRTPGLNYLVGHPCRVRSRSGRARCWSLRRTWLVRSSTNLGLRGAKDLVDTAPSVVLDGATLEQAEHLVALLGAQGVTTEIVPEQAGDDPYLL